MCTIKLGSRWRNIKNRKSNCDCAAEFWKLRNGSREVFSCGEKIDIFPETQVAHRAGCCMEVFEHLHRSDGLQNKRFERRIASVGPGDDVKENLCLLCRGKFASLLMDSLCVFCVRRFSHASHILANAYCCTCILFFRSLHAEITRDIGRLIHRLINRLSRS